MPTSKPDLRPGMQLDYLRAKRQAILDELHSDEHYEDTETLYYGDHDPFSVPIAPCDGCGHLPRMIKDQERPVRWIMQCSCGERSSQSRPRPWQAALDWNMKNLSVFDYKELPLFGLGSLGPEDAHKRLVGIKSNLELRRKLLGLSRTIGQRTKEIEVPGKKYQERLDAYLQWSLWALRMTKLARSSKKQ